MSRAGFPQRGAEEGDLRKKIATLSNDKILTARLGCLARTLAASSCTEREIAIRRAMSTSRERNDARPDPSDVLGVGFASHPLRLSSLDAIRNVRGSAVSMMESTRTAATSSSSDICASSAASINSRPMPKETLNARSEPKDPSAAAVSVMLPSDSHDVLQVVYQESVQSALIETHHLPARLAWQATAAGGAPLVMRRLLVAPRGVKRGRDGVGGPQRAVRGRKAEYSRIHCAGTVFGCTLGNLMQHSRGQKHRLMYAMRALRNALAPAGRALSTSAGEDIGVLVRGLACHRVLQIQFRKLRELKRAPAIDSKMGHIGVVLGTAASLMVAFECMALDEDDAPTLRSQISMCLSDAHTGLASWRSPDNLDDDMRHALDVEIRALERARFAISRATDLSDGMDAAASVRMQLDCFRRAAWPRNETLGKETHTCVLERIRTGEIVDVECDFNVLRATNPNVVSLAALPSGLGSNATGSCGSGSSQSASSGWSFSSGGSEAAIPLFVPDLSILQASWNSSLLTPAARSASSTSVIIDSPTT